VSNRVLVVDDDPTICELIQEVLSSAQMESFAITDSKKAETHLAQEKFGAVFLDVRMPPPDGIELTRRTRASGLNRTTPIVIITGEDDNAVLARAFEAGANFFLCHMIFGSMRSQEALHSLTLFSREVAPALDTL